MRLQRVKAVIRAPLDALFAFVLFLSLAVSSSTHAAVITLAYSNVESFPFLIGDGYQIADPPGLAVEIIDQAAQDIGVNVHFARYPNKRVFSYLEKGIIDGAFIYSYESERAKKAQFPMVDNIPDSDKRIATLTYYLYKNKNSELQWDGENISGLTGSVGANAGYSIVTDLLKMGVPVKEYYGGYEKSKIFTLLEMNRIQAVAVQDITTDPYLELYAFNDVEKIPLPLKSKDYYLIFSHKFMAEHPDIAEQLWQRVSEIRASQTADSIENYSY